MREMPLSLIEWIIIDRKRKSIESLDYPYAVIIIINSTPHIFCPNSPKIGAGLMREMPLSLIEWIIIDRKRKSIESLDYPYVVIIIINSTPHIFCPNSPHIGLRFLFWFLFAYITEKLIGLDLDNCKQYMSDWIEYYWCIY